jgi:hypothetical protein
LDLLNHSHVRVSTGVHILSVIGDEFLILSANKWY